MESRKQDKFPLSRFRAIARHPKGDPMKIPFITEIQRFSLQDGPGIRTTIFMKGCPLKCPWCHNPETQNSQQEIYYYLERCTACGKCTEICPSQASSLSFDRDRMPLITLDRTKCQNCRKCIQVCPSGARAVVGQPLSLVEIMQEAVADQAFFGNSGGGVTISGGEPLLFPEFSLELAKRLKSAGVHCAMETSCFASWEKIEPFLEYVDLFLVDIKTLDEEKHKSTVGWPLPIILKNIETLAEHKATIRIHLPIIPGFNNSLEDYHAIIEYLRKLFGRISGIDILPYHCYAENKYTLLGRDYRFKGVSDLPGTEVVPLVQGLRLAGAANVTVGGLVGMGASQGRQEAR